MRVGSRKRKTWGSNAISFWVIYTGKELDSHAKQFQKTIWMYDSKSVSNTLLPSLYNFRKNIFEHGHSWREEFLCTPFNIIGSAARDPKAGLDNLVQLSGEPIFIWTVFRWGMFY